MAAPAGDAADGSATGDLPPRPAGLSRENVPLSVIWCPHPARRRLRAVSPRQAIRPQADYRLPGSRSPAAAAFAADSDAGGAGGTAPRQLVPRTLQWNPAGHTPWPRPGSSTVLAADLPPGWYTQPDHLHHTGPT